MSHNPTAPAACVLPTIASTKEERASYLQCRAKSLTYQAQELSTALVREGFHKEAYEVRAASSHLILAAMSTHYEHAPDSKP